MHSPLTLSRLTTVVKAKDFSRNTSVIRVLIPLRSTEKLPAKNTANGTINFGIRINRDLTDKTISRRIFTYRLLRFVYSRFSARQRPLRLTEDRPRNRRTPGRYLPSLHVRLYEGYSRSQG